MSSGFLFFIFSIILASLILSCAYMFYTIKLQYLQNQAEQNRNLQKMTQNNLEKIIAHPDIDYLSRWRLIKNGDNWEKIYEPEVLDINDYR